MECHQPSTLDIFHTYSIPVIYINDKWQNKGLLKNDIIRDILYNYEQLEFVKHLNEFRSFFFLFKPGKKSKASS